MNSKSFMPYLFLVALSAPVSAVAVEPSPVKNSAIALEVVAATVKRVQLELGTVTSRHGEIKSHAMPPMTMVFKADSDLL